MALRAALPLLLCCYTAHALRLVTVPQRTPQLRALRAPAAPSLCASSTPPPKAPDGRTIRRFAIPALGLWLNGPLLSLVDTSAVGLSALPGTGATQLAALGPATTFCDGAIYLFAFLNVATTNLYASAQATEGGEVSLESEGVVRCAARVALLCGLGAMAVVLAMGTRLLKLYVGAAASADAALLLPAAEYVAIRSLSFPAAFLAGVLQASLLGAKDSLTPLLAVAASTLVNVVGDFVLVGLMRWGLRGAAIATSAAQCVATAALVRSARPKLVPTLGWLPQAWRQNTARAASRVSARSFLVFALPVLTLIVGKISAFGFMTHAAAGLGRVPLATHQIVLTLFFVISPFLEVISQTAQAFLPAYYSAPAATADRHAWRAAALALASRLLRLGVVVGGVAAALFGAAVPLRGAGLLTNDPAVAVALKPLALPLSIGALLTAPVAVSEGVLLARRQLRYLCGVYVASVALLPPALLSIKRAGGPVVNVWWCFAAFQAGRAACFTAAIYGPPLWRRLRPEAQRVE